MFGVRLGCFGIRNNDAVRPLQRKERKEKKKRMLMVITNVNLSPFALLCSRVPLVRCKVHCLPCSRWTLFGAKRIVGELGTQFFPKAVELEIVWLQVFFFHVRRAM